MKDPREYYIRPPSVMSGVARGEESSEPVHGLRWSNYFVSVGTRGHPLLLSTTGLPSYFLLNFYMLLRVLDDLQVRKLITNSTLYFKEACARADSSSVQCSVASDLVNLQFGRMRYRRCAVASRGDTHELRRYRRCRKRMRRRRCQCSRRLGAARCLGLRELGIYTRRSSEDRSSCLSTPNPTHREV